MKIIEAFKKALIIREECEKYYLHNGYPINLANLVDAVERYAEQRIQLIALDFDPTYFFARLERYENNSAVIVFSSHLDEKHVRYAVTKELSHLLIDTEDSFTKVPINLAIALVDDQFSELLKSSEVLQSESLSHLVACELLMPYSERDHYINAVNGRKMSCAEIAERHAMPQSFVEALLLTQTHEALRAIMQGCNDL